MGSERRGRGRPPARLVGHRRRDHRALPDADLVLQEAAVRRVRAIPTPWTGGCRPDRSERPVRRAWLPGIGGRVAPMRIGVIGRGGPGWLADVLATAQRVDEASLDTFWVNQAFSVDPLT